MSQNSQSLVKVDAQALTDAVNRRLSSKYGRAYIGSVRAGTKGHKALRDIVLEEETKILRQAATEAA
jgi:translation initiation factor 2 alpha subunit (eIF-2alpha)